MSSVFPKYNIAFLGTTNVGKTSLYEAMIGGSTIDPLPTTICSNFWINTSVDDQMVSIQLTDTAGQEKYRAIATPYIRNADGIFLVYDLMNMPSFEALNDFYKMIKNTKPDASILLIGNKTDLVSDSQNEYDRMAEAFKETINAIGFIKTSALTHENVNEAFQCMVKNLFENKNKCSIIVNNTVSLKDSQDENRHRCC